MAARHPPHVPEPATGPVPTAEPGTGPVPTAEPGTGPVPTAEPGTGPAPTGEPALGAPVTGAAPAVAVTRGCPDLGGAGVCADGTASDGPGPDRPLPDVLLRAPATSVEGAAEAGRVTAARTGPAPPPTTTPPPNDNSDIGGSAADNLPQGGRDAPGDLPRTGGNVLAMIAVAVLLAVSGATLRVLAGDRRPGRTA